MNGQQRKIPGYRLLLTIINIMASTTPKRPFPEMTQKPFVRRWHWLREKFQQGLEYSLKATSFNFTCLIRYLPSLPGKSHKLIFFSHACFHTVLSGHFRYEITFVRGSKKHAQRCTGNEGRPQWHRTRCLGSQARTPARPTPSMSPEPPRLVCGMSTSTTGTAS